MLKESVMLRMRALGNGSPEVATALKSLAQLLQAQVTFNRFVCCAFVKLVLLR